MHYPARLSGAEDSVVHSYSDLVPMERVHCSNLSTERFVVVWLFFVVVVLLCFFFFQINISNMFYAPCH